MTYFLIAVKPTFVLVLTCNVASCTVQVLVSQNSKLTGSTNSSQHYVQEYAMVLAGGRAEESWRGRVADKYTPRKSTRRAHSIYCKYHSCYAEDHRVQFRRLSMSSDRSFSFPFADSARLVPLRRQSLRRACNPKMRRS